MLEGHRQATLDRIQNIPGNYILALQDTTLYNYTTHSQMKGLGKIQGAVKGILQHNVLTVSDKGLPLGLIHQQYWTREGHQPFEGSESLKWNKGLQAVNKHLAGGNRPVVLVQDREADIAAFFEQTRGPGVELLVRVHQPRALEDLESGQVAKLTTYADGLPVIGHQELRLVRNGKSVNVGVSLQACRIGFWTRQDADKPAKKIELGLVIAGEVSAITEDGTDVFQVQDRAVWYLLTSLPIDREESVARVVYFYSLRWRIERFHYSLKSGGFSVEKLQFDDLETTLNALSFYSVVAWQLLSLMYALREVGPCAAAASFDAEELHLLGQLSPKPIETVQDATLTLSKLVGFAPSKKQPMPGVKVLGQALERFYYLKMGYGLKPT